MIDPAIAGAALAAATLFATKLTETAGGEAGKAVAGLASRIAGLIHGKAVTDAETKAAVTLVEAGPDDGDHVRQLGKVLAARATTDRAFGEELAKLVEEARAAGLLRIGNVQSVGPVSGNARVEMTGGDTYVAGRDQVFGVDRRGR